MASSLSGAGHPLPTAPDRPHNQGGKHRRIIIATWGTVLLAGRSAARRTNSDTGTRRSWLGPLSGDIEARRRVRRMVGVGGWDGASAPRRGGCGCCRKVECCSDTRHPWPRTLCYEDDTIVFHVCLKADCCDMRNFSTSLTPLELFSIHTTPRVEHPRPLCTSLLVRK